MPLLKTRLPSLRDSFHPVASPNVRTSIPLPPRPRETHASLPRQSSFGVVSLPPPPEGPNNRVPFAGNPVSSHPIPAEKMIMPPLPAQRGCLRLEMLTKFISADGEYHPCTTELRAVFTAKAWRAKIGGGESNLTE